MTKQEIADLINTGVRYASLQKSGRNNETYWVDFHDRNIVVNNLFRFTVALDHAIRGNWVDNSSIFNFSLVPESQLYDGDGNQMINPLSNASKIEKIPVRPLKEDKYKTDLVLELNKMEIYLSEALRAYLNLNEGNRIAFAVDRESEQYFVYVETEAENGYEITPKGTIVDPTDIIELQSRFNTNVLHLEPRPIKRAEEPAYLFYEIVAKEVKPKKSVSRREADKKSSTSAIVDDLYPPMPTATIKAVKRGEEGWTTGNVTFPSNSVANYKFGIDTDTINTQERFQDIPRKDFESLGSWIMRNRKAREEWEVRQKQEQELYDTGHDPVKESESGIKF